MSISYYKNMVCLNVLAKDLENAIEIYQVLQGHVIVGVLSSAYEDTQAAITDMRRYHDRLNGNLSVGLGGGNPAQCYAVADIAKQLHTNHYNQVFSAVGYTRANIATDDGHINALISPTGKPGYVKISTGPLSQKGEPAIVPIETAILMVKEMGGNALKFFPMDGLSCRDELEAVARACAKQDFALEPTGGIDLDNFEEILTLILACGVNKVIPHVYSSIIEKTTGKTSIEDVKRLYMMMRSVVDKFV